MKVVTNGKGWTRVGEILEKKSKSCKKHVVVESCSESITDAIENEFKTLEFKRGVTYKMLAKKYRTTVNFVFNIRKKIKENDSNRI